MFGRASDQWSTPRRLFDALDQQFVFTRDACCRAGNAKFTRCITAREHGLRQDWGSNRVFMNPPYSQVQDLDVQGIRVGASRGGGRVSGPFADQHRVVASLRREWRSEAAEGTASVRGCAEWRTLPDRRLCSGRRGVRLVSDVFD